MLVLLSPSKKLDEKSFIPTQDFTMPEFLSEAEILASNLKKLSAGEVGDLMHLSTALSHLNFERFQNFHTPFTAQNARPALYTFKGDVYDKMDIENYNNEDLKFAQKHVRILSGLYGILKPLDLMQPYRLEMGTKFKTNRGANLYAFWGTQLTKSLNAQNPKTIVNLASNEYFSAIKPKELKAPLLNITFKQYKDGKLKNIGLMAKRARGMMADFIIKNKIEDITQLQKFNVGGYSFNPELSKEMDWVFTMNMDA